MIVVTMPYHLRTLAQVDGEVQLDVPAPVTQRAILDALEAKYPVLKGAIRDYGTLRRRPFIRLFACQEDRSNDDPDMVLPDAIADGTEPYMIVGAIAGG